MSEEGILFILSGPSGVGKGTVRENLFKQNTNVEFSISKTTREKRPGEKNGVDYYFTDEKRFTELIEQGKLLEYAKYVHHYYGTPREYVEKTLAAGKDVFLEIEVQGAMQVKENMPEGVFIFLIPPSLEELKNRILHRGTETEASMMNRLEQAKKEIQMMNAYDYVIVNDDVDQAVEKIQAIIKSEHCKREKVAQQYKKLLEEDMDVRTIN